MKNLENRVQTLEQKHPVGKERPKFFMLCVVAPGDLNPEYNCITDYDDDSRRWWRQESESWEDFKARVEAEVESNTPHGKVTFLIADVVDKTTGDQP